MAPVAAGRPAALRGGGLASARAARLKPPPSGAPPTFGRPKGWEASPPYGPGFKRLDGIAGWMDGGDIRV